MPILPPEGSYGLVAWWAVPLYLFSLLFVHFFRAYRCGYLLKPLGNVTLRKILLLGWAGFFAIMMLPLRMGEFARPYLFKKEAGISMSAGMGTIAIERIVDGVIVSLWLTIALFAIPASNSPYIWVLRLVPLVLFVVSLLVLIALILWTERFRRITEKLTSLIGKRLQGFVLHVFDGFINGLKSLPQKRMVLGFIVYSLFYWGLNAVGVLLLAVGCGIDFGIGGAIAVMGVLAVGILLPTGPGYFGNFQASVMIALAMYMPDEMLKTNGAIFIFILYLSQSAVTIVAGIAGFMDANVSFRKLIMKPETKEEWSDVP